MIMTCTCLRVVAETQVEVAVTNGKMLTDKRGGNTHSPAVAARSDVPTQLLSVGAGSKE